MQCETCGDLEFKVFLEAIYNEQWWHVDNSDYLDIKFVLDWMEDWNKENGR